MQKEIIRKHPLLSEAGELIETGYAKNLIVDYDRKKIKASELRIKEWDYYLINNDDYAIALTVADNSYMGLISASLINFKEKWEITTSDMKFLTLGKTNLPNTSKTGDIKYTNNRINLSFKNDGAKRFLHFEMKNFKGHDDLLVDLELSDIPKESMVIVTPFKNDKLAFYYNQKINCMKAKGKVTYNNTEYIFKKDDSFGVLDWGRGVWTYDNTWYWASASGKVNEHSFGFNLGYGFGDNQSTSENMLFYDGIAHKLDKVIFQIPMIKNSEDYLSPWVYSSNDGRFEMQFVPIIDRASKTSAVVIESDQHQVFGRFSGFGVLDDGTKIEVKDLLGFGEKVRNRW